MSVFDTIDAVRKQPKHIRNAYAFWIAVGCTAVLLVVWVTTIPARLAIFSPDALTSNAAEKNSAVEIPEPGRWSRLSASLQQAFNRGSGDTTPTEVRDAPLPGVVMPELSAISVVDADEATTTPLVWTEQVAAAKTYNAAEARPVLIATTSSAVSATTSSNTNVVQ